MQNTIYKIKYFVISVLWLGGVVFDSAWEGGGGIYAPHHHHERNTAWNRGRKFFHCLGAPNNLIRPWVHTYPPMKMEQTECSETLPFNLQTPVNRTEESTQHSEHGGSLRSRTSWIIGVHIIFIIGWIIIRYLICSSVRLLLCNLVLENVSYSLWLLCV
jgi:hypothetical protein